MQKKPGRGWHGNSEGHKKAGQRGGKARKKQLKNSGQSYAEIGRMGGNARKQQILNDPNFSYAQMGRMGGKARSKLNQ